MFVANAVLLSLQLTSARLLAPYLGSSLETWTALIGVFLAGICLGNAYGGWLADRAASVAALGRWLLAGTAAAFWLLLLTRGLGDGDALRAIPLAVRIPTLTALACFPVAFALSVLTPVAIRLLLDDVTHAGGVVGFVYALGTFGSLAGNFVTGYVLIERFGVAFITVTATATILLLALIPAGPSRVAHVTPAPPVPPADAPADGLTGQQACFVVFAASFCSMALELLATRILAPELGMSLYTWTGVIGVVLLGVGIGNQVGGWVADRSPRRETLGNCLFFAGLFALGALIAFALLSFSETRQGATAPNTDSLTGYQKAAEKIVGGAYRGLHLGLLGKVLLWAACMFLPPMLFLGAVSPQVTRLAVRGLDDTGRTAGRIYAWSCAGAILGTFATGWYLIALFGAMRLLLGVSLALVLLSVWVGRSWRRHGELFGTALVGGATVTGFVVSGTTTPYQMETNYYALRYHDEVRQADGVQVRSFALDALVHSYIKGEPDDTGTFVADPSYLGYEHERVQAEFARALATTPDPRVLVIGGGGYTLPRWVERELPRVRMEVVEIDPGVTEFTHRYLGLPRTTRVASHHLDGRQFVQERADRGAYGLVVQDAVNDYSVPYHIMTREYNAAVGKLLTPDGVYLLTVIDEYEDGQLLRAAVRTMQQTFAHVGLLGADERWEETGRSVFVIYGSAKPFDGTRLATAAKAADARKVSVTVAMPQEKLAAYLAAKPSPVLTDDYAPVDHLMRIAFDRRKDAK